MREENERGFRLLHPESVGYLAHEALSGSVHTTVVGVTSRGFFLGSTSRWLAFVSSETIRSPLTITLKEPTDAFSIAAGASVAVQADKLCFHQVQLAITLPIDAVWQPGQAKGWIAQPSQQLRTLEYIAARSRARSYRRGLGALLDRLLQPGVDSPLATQEQAWAWEGVLLLQAAWRARDLRHAVTAAHCLLGLGSGLTPSGDDFLIGMLLFLNRWPDNHRMRDYLAHLNEAIVNAAYQRSTRLSANLIECATRGQSDERLTDAVDTIVCGQPSTDQVIGPLLKWGASSGVDALVGVAAALMLCISTFRDHEGFIPTGQNHN